ncbi:rej domain containing protein [Stylonychia lemnae]|uniref:Rej domain containing protein n=1 Tax=Stylonychia lemnae TaxID=5949 RepID=A0A078APM1_STYLE|nr:rej domain containing protein [Stylonychia lemnae]|eukprot:CDW84325.1 rej domain containing protein [Stylonychia lemnae]
MKKLYTIDIFVILISLFILTPTTFQDVLDKTNYDGVTSSYNQYPRFYGGQGIYLQNTISNVNNYTLTLWMKLSDYPWEIRKDFDIISFAPDSLSISLNRNKDLTAISDRGGQLRISGEQQVNNWYIIILRSSQVKSDFQIRDQLFIRVSQDSSTSFFPTGQTSLNLEQTVIGIDKDRKSNGFMGNIRNIKLLSLYLDDSQTQRIQFTKLLPMRDLKLQLSLFDVNSISNEADRAVGELIRTSNIGPTNQIDYLGSLDCSVPQNGNVQIVKFSQGKGLAQISIPTNLFTPATHVNTTLQMWFKRNAYPMINTLTHPVEELFIHQNVTSMTFQMNDYQNMKIAGRDGKAITTKTAFNRWMYLQVISTNLQLIATIYDYDGVLTSTNTLTYSKSYTTNSRIINLATNFNGFIYAFKLFKTAVPPTNGIYNMDYRVEINSNALLYFIFTTVGLAQDSSFQNLVNQGTSLTVQTTGTRVYASEFLTQMGTTYTNMSINYPNYFNGFTCTDQYEKLFMTDDSSYAVTNFTLNSTLSSYTVEFWVRPTQTISGSPFFLALQDTTRQKQIFLSIIQEGTNLYCYPFYTQNVTLKLDYLDYLNNIQDWIHIVCGLNGQQSSIQGQLYYKTNDFTYFADLPSTSQQNLLQNQYQLYLSQNPLIMRNGIPKSYFSEVRFWDYLRDQYQIRSQRFMRLNITLERQNLYSYMKLAYSNYGGVVNEIDFADGSLQKEIQFKNVKWQQSKDLLICPEGYYRGEIKDYNCYLDGIINLDLSIYKFQNRYIVTPKYSTFRNSFVRENVGNLYDFSWTLDSTDTSNATNTKIFPSYFNPQSKNQELSFDYDMVTDRPAKYDFTLKVSDKNNRQKSQKQSVSLKTYRCANIFDSTTKQSLVFMDMQSTKTVENAVFQYEYSDCSDYQLDQSAMSFSIDISGVTLLSSDHNREAKTFTLRKQQQSNIPSNDYFYIRIKGVWRSSINRNNIIEYNLIYACRYIAKLIITLTPSYNIVALGQTLSIDQQAKFYNLNKAVENRDYSGYWTCPGKLFDFCRSQTTTSLKLNYDQVVNSGIELWKSQNISYTANLKFIQGDGTRMSSANVFITWMNLRPSANLTQINKSIIANRLITYQLDIASMTEDQISIKWSTSPQISNNCLINGIDRKQFVFNSSCLSSSTNYTLQADVYFKNQTQLLVTRSTKMYIQSGPTGGKFTCSPTSGKAYQDDVKCTSTGWQSDQLPLRYQYFATDNLNNLVALSALSIFPDIQFNTPPTNRITIKVVDLEGKSTTSFITASFTHQSSQNNQTLNKIKQVIARNNPQVLNTNLVADLQSAAFLLNMNQNSIDSENADQLMNDLVQMVHSQSLSLSSFNSSDQKQYFIQGALQIFIQLSNYSKSFQIDSLSMIQESIKSFLNQTQLQEMINDQEFNENFMQIQANILQNLYNYQLKGAFVDLSNSQADKLASISSQMRSIIDRYDKMIASQLSEGQVVKIVNNAFNMTLQKFSRLANLLYDINSFDSNMLQYQYPLSSALQPTERQTLTVINFDISPFIGSKFFNQSAISNNSIYFSYRDMNGNYLSGDNILGKIQMVFKYQYSPLNNIVNQTTCGYINSDETRWENSSCDVIFLRSENKIICQCRHMSFYSIIDDYLIRESSSIYYLTFNNWYSIIPFGYMLLLFIFGLIYTYSMDNRDYRELNKSDDTLGNELVDVNSLSIQSLVFRKKVYYSGFGQKYSFCTFFRLIIMQIHPLFQIKYSFDPQLPRFYKFMFLYTRIMIILGVSFYFTRNYNDYYDVKDEDDILMTLIKIFGIVLGGALILPPLPYFLFCCCRSRYFLIRNKIRPGSDFENDGPKNQPASTKDIERFTNVIIDPNLPLKLLFFLNQASTDKILREYKDNMEYSSGAATKLGEKLLELDVDLHISRQLPNTENEIGEQTARKFNAAGDQTPEKSDRHSSKRNLNEENNDHLQQTSLKPTAISAGFESKEKFMSVNSISRRKTQAIKFQSTSSPERRAKTQIIDHNDLDYEIREDEEQKADLDINKQKNPQFQKQNQLIRNDDTSPEQHQQYFTDNYIKGMNQNQSNFSKQNLMDVQQHYEDKSKSDIMMDSYIGSLESQTFYDDKKELVENTNYCGRLFGNILAFIINMGILLVVFYLYITEKYYLESDHYIWVCIFFAAQILSFFILDFVYLFFISVTVSSCCRKSKTCKARMMRECLNIYEDYKYVVNFTETKIE